MKNKKLFALTAAFVIATLYGGCAGGGGGTVFVWFSTDRDGQFEIYRMHSNGGNLTQLTATGGFNEGAPSVTADGTLIVYHRGPVLGPAGDSEGPITGGLPSDIFSMNADGSNQTNLTNSAGPLEFNPSIRRDGTLIAYQRDGAIWSMDPDGSNPTNLTFGAGENDPSFSPDGTKIAFVRTANIWVMDADGQNQTQLTNAGQDDDPSWHPDGTKIAFERNDGGGDDIWVMDSDGQNATEVYDSGDDDDDPVYTPNGSHIIFQQGSPDEVYRMRADGTGATNISNNGAEDQDPATLAGP